MREVKRKANIGEKIKIVDALFSFGNYKDGDVLTVSRILGSGECDEGCVCVKEFEQPFILTREYVVLEGENEMRFKVGDKARVKEGLLAKNNYGGLYFTPSMEELCGCEVEITLVKDNGNYAVKESDYFFNDAMLEPAPFTLSDLKPCMVVKLRDGQLFLVSQLESGLGLVKEREGKSLYFGDFNDDLTFKDSNRCDITEVYGYRKDYFICSLDLSSFNRELLWKREEPKPKRKMTIDEICKELGEEIEIVKGE